MEDDFYKDDFEKFLQEQANNHRMYPSDSAWRNIHKKLHEDNNWPALTVVAITFLAAIVAISIHFSPRPNIFATKTASIPKENNKGTTTPLLDAVTNGQARSTGPWSFSEEVIEQSRLGTVETPLQEAPVRQETVPVIGKDLTITKSPFVAVIKRPEPVVKPLDKNRVAETPKEISQKGSLIINATTELTESFAESTHINAEQKSAYQENSDLENQGSVEQADTDLHNLNSISTRKKVSNSRFSLSVYATGSKSFRRLVEDPSMSQQPSGSGPVALNYVADVNKIVRHTPGTGVEAGVMFGYDLIDRITITSGLQFNIRQYEMDAFIAHTEVANIAVQSVDGFDTITRYSPYRTSLGFATTQLLNRYYQLSFPLGLQYRVLGSKNLSLNVAGSIQPTYLLKTDSYLLSTNSKNYAKSDGMQRDWNINTSIEAFLKIKSGNYNWQFGPQFRYQQLPTYMNAYPIKEYLLDYGFKIGVSKSIR